MHVQRDSGLPRGLGLADHAEDSNRRRAVTFGCETVEHDHIPNARNRLDGNVLSEHRNPAQLVPEDGVWPRTIMTLWIAVGGEANREPRPLPRLPGFVRAHERPHP